MNDDTPRPQFHGMNKEDAIARAKSIDGIVVFSRAPDVKIGAEYQQSDLWGYWSDVHGFIRSWERVVWQDGKEVEQ